jgi:hypothetical protein
VIAYFVAGILPVIVERGDRNREIKVRTSQNIMLLIDQLSEVEATDDKAEMLKALGGQLVLDTYATYDEPGRTSEADQIARDTKLLRHLAKLNGLDWDALQHEGTLSAVQSEEPPKVSMFPGSGQGNAVGGKRVEPGRRKRPSDEELDELVAGLS